MDASTNPNDTTQQFSQFTAVQAEVLSLRLTGRWGIDQVAEILYELRDTTGHFSISTHVVGPGTPTPTYRELSEGEMQALLTNLRAEERHTPHGIDVTALRAFVHLLSQELENQPSTRFNTIRFGDVTQDASNAIIGHVGLGVDVVGTIHDANGVVTFEQHIVPLTPRPYRRLSSSDRAALADALDKYIASAQPAANPLWTQVLQDLRK